MNINKQFNKLEPGNKLATELESKLNIFPNDSTIYCSSQEPNIYQKRVIHESSAKYLDG